MHVAERPTILVIFHNPNLNTPTIHLNDHSIDASDGKTANTIYAMVLYMAKLEHPFLRWSPLQHSRVNVCLPNYYTLLFGVCETLRYFAHNPVHVLSVKLNEI